MIIIPAVDIRMGKCVRLIQGDVKQEIVYDQSPLEMAEKWEKMGAQYLHIVDLDGAFEGKPVNDELIIEIRKKIKIPIEVGGGIRTLKDAKLYINKKINRVILGTAVVEDIELLKEFIKKFGAEKIVVGLDLKDKKIGIKGWKSFSDLNYIDFIKQLISIGIKNIIVTNISRDGTLSGTDFEDIIKPVSDFNVNYIVSGGVGSTKDLEAIKHLKLTNISGIIIGRALYDGRLTLAESISTLVS